VLVLGPTVGQGGIINNGEKKKEGGNSGSNLLDCKSDVPGTIPQRAPKRVRSD